MLKIQVKTALSRPLPYFLVTSLLLLAWFIAINFPLFGITFRNDVHCCQGQRSAAQKRTKDCVTKLHGLEVKKGLKQSTNATQPGLHAMINLTEQNSLEHPKNHSKIRKKRLIDADDEIKHLEDESRMFALQVKIPDLPNVDIGRILELYKPAAGFNTYEKRALKDVITFVRTKTFQFALTKLDTSWLYATFHLTRGQFLKKLMTFLRQMHGMEADLLKATEILENLVDKTYDNDAVEQDVLDELDEIDESNGRLSLREDLVAMLNNASNAVINAAVHLRKFLRNPDLRFGLLFRGLNYALSELTLEQRLSVILLRLKSYMKTTLTPMARRSIDTILGHLKFDQYKPLTNTTLMDVYNSISGLPSDLQPAYQHILSIGAIEELGELHSFPDIAHLFTLGLGSDANIAMLLRTLTVQFMMSLPPDRESAKFAKDIFNHLFSSKKNVALYDAPKIILNEISKLTNVSSFMNTLLDKVTSTVEKYGPILYLDLAGLAQESSGLELLIRSLNYMKFKLPQSELKTWHIIQQILDEVHARQDYEPAIPSGYNFADEFTIACRLSSIQKQYRLNTISQIIAHKNELQHIFHGMRMLRQLPIRIRVIILLNRIDSLNLPYLTQNFKFQLRSVIKEMTGDDEINEIVPFDLSHLNLLFTSTINSIDDLKYQRRFKLIYHYLVTHPEHLNSIQREVIFMHDYTPHRQLAMLLREMYTNRLGLPIPSDILQITAKCLHLFNSIKTGDEQFIRIQTTIERIMDRVFSGSEFTQHVIEARETLKDLYRAGIVDFKYLLRDVRLHKYNDRTQFLILLYRTAAVKSLFTDSSLYDKYGHAVRTLVNYFGVDLDDIRTQAVDLPEEIEDLLEIVLPDKAITRTLLRARIVLIRALETNVIDRRIAYDGIQCYARAAPAKKKLEYIIENIWPMRADIPNDVSRAIHTIRDFAEIDVDDLASINIYSFDFQEVFDDVITPKEPQTIIKAKEILYMDLETNTGRYRTVLADFKPGKKYPIQDIARMIAQAIVERVDLKQDKKLKDAARQILEFLTRNDLELERSAAIEQLLTGNAQNYVG